MTRIKFEAKYRIKVSACKQGQRISVDDLEKILRCLRTTAKFVDERLFFHQELEDHLWAMDRQWVVCIENHEVAILTDMEASKYEERQARLATAKLKRVHREMKAVKRNNLTAQRRREHDRELFYQGLELQSLKAARRATPPPPQPTRQIVPPDPSSGPFRRPKNPPTTGMV
jgi:hypothetical protein